MHLLLKFLEMLLHSMHIRRDIIHHNIKLCRFLPLCYIADIKVFDIDFDGSLVLPTFLLLAIDEVCMSHSNDVLMVHLFMDLQFSALVSLILSQLFDSNDLACTLKRAHEDFCKGAHSTLDLSGKLVVLLCKKI